MAIIKCKMCGGEIELSADKTYGTCEFCGSTMTFPKVDDDQRAAAFNRGNHFRRIGEFDKALTVYEHLVNEDPTDAEAHWCSALCRFGIEYVKDPASGEYMPTCHRASFDSFLEDVDCKAAIEYADASAKRQYEHDAIAIEEVRRGILVSSQNEQPYDVFICYKEADEHGQRTVDSLRAQEIYYQLTDQGRRVFFARITLEDKAGQQFEPYIFAALNSAKVMIVVGTCKEHLEAVWVKNEWSRFLAIMKRDRKKLLIPCYSEMDPYDMPEQLSVLQSYDMTKIGFIQDLNRGIAKVLDADEKPARTVTVKEAGGGNASALLKRGNMALEDGDWEKADGFFEDVLNQDPENAEAYVGKTLVMAKRRSLDDFIQWRLSSSQDVKENKLSISEDTKRIEDAVAKYAVPGYVEGVEVKKLYNYDLIYISSVQSRKTQKLNEERFWKEHKQLGRARQFASGAYKIKLDDAYQSLMSKMDERIAAAQQQEKVNEKALRTLYTEFLNEADEKAASKYARADECRKADYRKACENQKNAISLQDYKHAKDAFGRLGEYQDSLERAGQCDFMIERLTAEANKKQSDEMIALSRALIKAQKRKKSLKIIFISIAIAAISIISISSIVNSYRKVSNSYADAELLLANGDIANAAIAFGNAKNHLDARERSMSIWEEVAVRDTIAVEYWHTVCLKSNGTVMATEYKGLFYSGECDVSGLKNIVAVAAGSSHTVGLKSDGTVVSVGNNAYGQSKVSRWKNIVSIAAGNYHTVGLKSDGTVVAVGNKKSGQCKVSDWENIIAIAAGDDHTVGLKSDGTVVAVGKNTNGQCNVSDWTDIIAIAAGGDNTVGLKADGTVIAIGNKSYGQCSVSNWKNIVAISAGGAHIVGLKSDGTVVAVGANGNGQCAVGGWSQIAAIAAGTGYTVGLRTDGTAVAVGDNLCGQCNVSDWQDIMLPKK